MAGARGQRINAGLLKNRAAGFLMQGALAETRAIENMFAGVNSSIASGRARKEREAARAQADTLARDRMEQQGRQFDRSQTRLESATAEQARHNLAAETAQSERTTFDRMAATNKLRELDAREAALAQAASRLPPGAPAQMMGEINKEREGLRGHFVANARTMTTEEIAGRMATLEAVESRVKFFLPTPSKRSATAAQKAANDRLSEVAFRKSVFTTELQRRKDMAPAQRAATRQANVAASTVSMVKEIPETEGFTGEKRFALMGYLTRQASLGRTPAELKVMKDDWLKERGIPVGGEEELSDKDITNQVRESVEVLIDTDNPNFDKYLKSATEAALASGDPGEAIRLLKARLGMENQERIQVGIAERDKRRAARDGDKGANGLRTEFKRSIFDEEGKERSVAEAVQQVRAWLTPNHAEVVAAQPDLTAFEKRILHAYDKFLDEQEK